MPFLGRQNLVLLKALSTMDDTNLRVAQLLASSARCSKLRQFPLELFGTHTSHPIATNNRSVQQKEMTAKYVSDPEGEKSDAGSGKRKAPEDGTVQEDVDHALGWSSSQPLRLRTSEHIRRGKIRVDHFAGDRQASTAISMAHLYGAHPPPMVQSGPVISSAPSSSSAGTTNPAGHTGGNNNTTGGTAATIARVVYAEQDEDVSLAGVDAEAPAEELLQYIKSLAAAKIAAYISAEEGRRKVWRSNGKAAGASASNNAGVGTAVVTGENSTATAAPSAAKKDGGSGSNKGGLMGRFDESAAIAVGVLVEELVRDMTLQWYKSGTPLGFEPRTLRTEALAQMRDAPNPKAITAQALQSTLEMLFGRDLTERTEDIALFRKIAIKEQKASKKGRTSARNSL